MRPVDIVLKSDSQLVPRDLAVTVGLIINELITNALKYASPTIAPAAFTSMSAGATRSRSSSRTTEAE